MNTSEAGNASKMADETNGNKPVVVGFKAHHAPGRSDNPLIAVEPPRREDLQPSYAQVLAGDDGAAHSWYGSMSRLHKAVLNTTMLTTTQSTASETASAR
jgi:hypothetical protein